jgi:hypothetical protein
MTAVPSCFTCQHFIEAWRCLAFSEVIPAEIAKGENLHTKPYPGDNGIQYQKAVKNEREN